MGQADGKSPEPGRLGGWAVAMCCFAAFKVYQVVNRPPKPSPPPIVARDSTLSPLQQGGARVRAQDLRTNNRQPAPEQPQPARRPDGLGGGEALFASRSAQPPLSVDSPLLRSQRPPSPPPRAAGPPPEVNFEVVTAANVDERLFLMRALETLYQGWPTAEAGDALDAAIAAMRHEAMRHQHYIQERQIEGRIALLYGDLVALLDTYADCLAEAGRIERGGAARAGRERTDRARGSRSRRPGADGGVGRVGPLGRHHGGRGLA